MSADFNIQDAFESLRTEIQTDRIALEKTIRIGFDKMHDKFDEHALEDAEKFSDLTNRIRDVEDVAKAAKNGFWWTIGTIITAAAGWISFK